MSDKEIQSILQLIFSFQTVNIELAINLLSELEEIPKILLISFVIVEYQVKNDLAENIQTFLHLKLGEKKVKILLQNLSLLLKAAPRPSSQNILYKKIKLISDNDALKEYNEDKYNIQELLESNPLFSPIYLAIGLYLTNYTKIKAEQIIPFYQINLKFQPENPYVLFALATLFEKREVSIEKSIELYQKFLEKTQNLTFDDIESDDDYPYWIDGDYPTSHNALKNLKRLRQ